MKTIALSSLIGTAFWSSHVFAGQPPVQLGAVLGNTLGAVLGTSLPVGIGGIAALAVVGLVAGTQLIKRKK